MGRLLFRLLFGGLALYFYFEDEIVGSVLCIFVLVASFLRQQIGPMVAVLPRLVTMRQEHDANSVLIDTFSLDAVFEHPALDRLFAQLSKSNKAPAHTLEDWRKLLTDSYRRKYKRDDSVCEVRFQVKANVLFINGELANRDHIYHELDIPYRWTEAGEPEDTTHAWPQIEAALSVRVLLLNGMLLLQVGRFSKEYSPKILRPGSLAIYETYATITSFPLMFGRQVQGLGDAESGRRGVPHPVRLG